MKLILNFRVKKKTGNVLVCPSPRIFHHETPPSESPDPLCASVPHSQTEGLPRLSLELPPQCAGAARHASLLHITVGGADDPALAVRAAARVGQRELQGERLSQNPGLLRKEQ